MAVGDTGIASLLQNPDVQKAIADILPKTLGVDSMADTSGTAGLGGALGAVLIGALLPRLVGNGLGVDAAAATHVGVDAAVAAALANANQVNNNSMLLLKDIQDSTAEVISSVGTAATQAQNTAIQGQIAALQGQASILAGVVAARGDTVNEIHEASTLITTEMNQLNTNLLQGFNATNVAITNDGDKTRALIQSIETANLNRLITERDIALQAALADRRSIDSGITVTNNINQNQLQQQQQQQFANINSTLGLLCAEMQRNTQSTINLGTMTGTTQTAANTRVSG